MPIIINVYWVFKRDRCDRTQFIHMKCKRLFTFVILPLLLAFGGTCMFIWNESKLGQPKEAKLLDNFKQHRVVYEELRDMLLVDTNLSRIAGWGVEIYKPFFLGHPSEHIFPLERYHKYLAWLHEAGADGASRNEGHHANPSILV